MSMSTVSTALSGAGWEIVGREGLRVSQGPRIEIPAPRIGYTRLFSPSTGFIAEVGAYSVHLWHAMNGSPNRARSISIDEAADALRLKGVEGLCALLQKQMR